jgi:hypothetical protein
MRSTMPQGRHKQRRVRGRQQRADRLSDPKEADPFIPNTSRAAHYALTGIWKS